MTLKKLLLGSSAALATLPALTIEEGHAQSVEYMRVCDAFGVGYHYIPGTQTCLKWSGHVRAEMGGRDDNSLGLDELGFANGDLTISGQSQVLLNVTWTDAFNDGVPDSNTNITVINSTSTISGIGNPDFVNKAFIESNFELVASAASMTEIGPIVGQFSIEGSSEGPVQVGDAWISIGDNILVGRETSRFDFGGGYGLYDGFYTDEGLNQFTFVLPIGHGVSLTLGAEDARDRRANLIQTNGAGDPYSVFAGGATGPTFFSNVIGPIFSSNFPSFGFSLPISSFPLTFTFTTTVSFSSRKPNAGYGGMEMPDIVASVRVEQAWGQLQLSGAVHQIRSIANTSVFGLVNVNFPNIPVPDGTEDEAYGYALQAGVELGVSAATKVKFVTGYADGAYAYIGGAKFAEATVDITTGKLKTKQGYYVLGSLSQDLGDTMNIALTSSFHEFEDQARLWQIGGSLKYAPVDNLSIQLGGQYIDVDYDPFMEIGYSKSDFDTYEVKLRVQRDF